MENDIFVIYLISFLTFIVVVILVEASYLLVRGVREEGSVKMNKRLKLLSAGGAHGKEVLDVLRRNELSSIEIVNRVLTKIPRIKAIDRMLEVIKPITCVSLKRFQSIKRSSIFILKLHGSSSRNTTDITCINNVTSA